MTIHVFNKFVVPLLCSDIDTKHMVQRDLANQLSMKKFIFRLRMLELATSNKTYSVVQHSSPIEDAYESVTEAKTGKTALQEYEN